MDETTLLGMLGDRENSIQVRVHALRQLRNGPLAPASRLVVAQTFIRLMLDDADPDLCLQAALALAEFTDVLGVPAALGRLALEVNESIGMRYTAFTSLQRAGPTTESVAFLRELLKDEILGRSARSVLAMWHMDEDTADGDK